MIYDVIIIGSGPAGYTAAIYTSRSFLKTLVITGVQPGGQLTTTTEVDNFPGFSEGILGPELLQKMKAQAERFGTQIITDVVSSVILSSPKAGEKSSVKDDNHRNTFIVKGQNETYEARSVIVATGASAKTLGIPSEETFRGKGISYCATCDGFFFRGKNIAVLGGGDTAMEEATFLTKFASHVTIIHRRGEFRASPIMIEKAKKDPKISFLMNTVVEEFYGDTALRGVKVRENKGDSEDKGDQGIEKQLQFDGVFVAIGHNPATGFLKNTIELDEKGYVKLLEVSSSRVQTGRQQPDKAQTATSVEGIFAAGDCVDARYRQGIVAAGMGCMAAMDTERYLQD